MAVCLSPPPLPSSPHLVSLASLLARSSEPCCSHVHAWWCHPLQALSGISAPGPSASFAAEAPRSPHPCPARCSVSSSAPLLSEGAAPLPPPLHGAFCVPVAVKCHLFVPAPTSLALSSTQNSGAVHPTTWTSPRGWGQASQPQCTQREFTVSPKPAFL